MIILNLWNFFEKSSWLFWIYVLMIVNWWLLIDASTTTGSYDSFLKLRGPLALFAKKFQVFTKNFCRQMPNFCNIKVRFFLFFNFFCLCVLIEAKLWLIIPSNFSQIPSVFTNSFKFFKTFFLFLQILFLIFQTSSNFFKLLQTSSNSWNFGSHAGARRFFSHFIKKIHKIC